VSVVYTSDYPSRAREQAALDVATRQTIRAARVSKRTLDVATRQTIRAARVSKRTLDVTLLIVSARVSRPMSACLRARLG